jgi:peptide/nickel transport system permease protein
MRRLVQRVARSLVVLLAVSAFTFSLTSLLPGDPAVAMLGFNATDETIAQVREQLNLDEPWPSRYVKWLAHAAHGDFGRSYLDTREVRTTVVTALAPSIQLMLYTQIISLLLAVPLGVLAAYRRGRPADRAISLFTFASISIPNFVLGVFLVFVFAITLTWFQPTGYTPFTESPWGNAYSLFLPAMTLAAGHIAIYARVLRTDMISTLQEDFITMARAKGVPPLRILFAHALRPSSFTLLTVAGINFASLVSSAVLVETIFNIPGIGRLTVNAINQRDYLLVQGCVLVIAVGFVIVNFLTDLAYQILDPRVRREAALG